MTEAQTPAGWYPDSTDPGQLRYWDGSRWTEHTTPKGPSQMPLGDQTLDVAQLTDVQREEFKRHSLTEFPTWLAVVLHFLTIGIFSIIYQGLKFSKLPLIKANDFTAGKGIGFLFIPFFNFYWQFVFWLRLTDRINFQFRLRDQPSAVSREYVLTTVIVILISSIGGLVVGLPTSLLVSAPAFVMGAIMVGMLQAATNRLVAGKEAGIAPTGLGESAGIPAQLGRLLCIVGAPTAFISLFLPWFLDVSAWELLSRGDIAVTLLASTILGLGISTYFSNGPAIKLLLLTAAGIELGFVAAYVADAQSARWGLYFSIVGPALCLVGAILLQLPDLARASPAPTPTATPSATPTATPTTPAATPATAPSAGITPGEVSGSPLAGW